MKNITVKIFSLAALVLAFVGCADIDTDTTTLNELEKSRKSLKSATSYYLGGDAFSLRLYSEGISVDYTASAAGKISDNSYKGDGYIVFIDSLFCGEVPEDVDYPVFPAGDFDVKESFSATTLNVAASNIYYVVLHNGSSASAAEKLRLIDGTVKVTQSGDNYTVTINGADNAGVKLDVSYTGKIEVAPKVAYANEPLAATTEDFTIDEIAFTSANADLELLLTPLPDGIMDVSLGKLVMTGAKTKIVIDEIVGPKYVIGEEPKRLPAGTYTVSPWEYDDNTFTPGEVWRGNLTGAYAMLLTAPGATTFTSVWYIWDGELVVEETATAYTIRLTAATPFGSTIKATYTESAQ
jgi:hypothetical protein